MDLMNLVAIRLLNWHLIFVGRGCFGMGKRVFLFADYIEDSEVAII